MNGNCDIINESASIRPRNFKRWLSVKGDTVITNIRIMARKATSVLLTLCVTVSLFTYGLSANAAAGGQMFEFKSTAGYPVVEYLSSTEFVKGDSYTFSCKFLATSNNFTYTTAQLKNVFIFWGANSSGGGTRPVWANMPGFSIGYNAETRTVTARFTAGDDSANGYTMTPGTNDYIQFRFGDRNAAFRGWGNFYFADFSLVRDNTGAEVFTNPIESSYVTSGAPASNKDKWSTAAAGAYCTVKEKGTTFDDSVQQGNTNLFYINGNQTNLQVQIRTTGDFFKYVAGERYEFTCKIKCNVSQYIKRGKLLFFNYYNNDDTLASINNTTDENFTESYDGSTCVYTAVFTVPSDCRNYTNTYFAFGDRNDQLSGYQAYFTDFAIKRISTGTVTVFPLITTDNVYNSAVSANDKYRIPTGQTSRVLVQDIGDTFEPGYSKQTYENVMQLRNAAGQNVYQVLGAFNFTYGNSYTFSIDVITRKLGENPDPRVRVYSAIGAGGAYREETLVRTEDTNTYTCTFAYQFSGSGDAFKIWIGTYDDEDNIVVGNPELYLLDDSEYKTGSNLISDPGFTGGVSDNGYSTAEHPWFSGGTAENVSIFTQPENYFAYDPTADYDTDTPKMLLLRDRAWMFLLQEVSSAEFEYGAQYEFSIDIIRVRDGSSGGTAVTASTLDSGDNWASVPLNRVEGTNRYSSVYTHQSAKTKGTAFQLRIYTKDVDDYCIIGNPELYRLESGGNKVGENLIKDPGFHTGINPANSWSEDDYPWFSSNYGNVSNTENCSFVKQPDNYFNIATNAEPDPVGTLPEKNMLRVESNGWESLIFEPYLSPGKTYRFTYNRKYFGNRAYPGDLVLRYRNSGGLTQLPDGNVTHYDEGYKTVYNIAVPDDAKTAASNLKFRFYFGEAEGNTVYIGNFDLREIDGSGNPTGNNLIANDGFYGPPRAVDTAGTDERGTPTPAMWSYAVGGTYKKADIVRMPENFFSETACAPKKAIKVTGSDWSCLRSSVHLEANTKYKLFYNYKYDTHAPRVSIQQIDSGNGVTALSFVTDEEKSEFGRMHMFTMGSDVASGKNCLLRFWLSENDCVSEAYWYDIKLYALDEHDKITGKNLLDNGDFAVGNTGSVSSIFGWEIEGAPFDSVELAEVPEGFFAYYSPQESVKYLIGELLEKNQTALYITLDRNKDGTVDIIDLIVLKKYYAYAGEDDAGDIPTDWYSDGKINITLDEVNRILSMEFVKPKNVIMMIGDGMGPNDIRLAEENSLSTYSFGLVMNRIVNTGFATTYSNSSSVTDSAAGGTALATGFKTDNGFIGVSPTGATLKNLSEYARDAGKKVGIVTNDGATGATPACFGAHVDSRGSTSDIAQQLVSFAPDVLIGQDYADFSGLDLSGFVLAQDFSEFRNVLNTYNRQCDKKFMGFINYNATYSGEINILSHCTETALNCLSKNSPDGFFLMVENTTTDNAGHANYISGKINGVVALDRAVAAVLKFMGDNPDTLLIITSDHETGGVTIPSGSYSLDASLFTTTKHTNANVRTFAVGYGAEYFNGVTVDNTDIGKFAINALTN